MKIFVIRHARSDYPHDRLSPEGEAIASTAKTAFTGFETIRCSERVRAQQTALALGYLGFAIDKRLNEYEDPEINAPTADEYVYQVHGRKWKALEGYGQNLLQVVEESTSTRTLLVTHNAIISAAFRILTGQITPIDNLGGFVIDRSTNNVALLNNQPRG